MEGGLTASTRAVATRNYVLTTAKALPQALSRAEYDMRPSTRRLYFFPPARPWLEFPDSCAPSLFEDEGTSGSLLA